ncbi:MAG: nuclear transport factor 2 family protein [Frankiaceae bacterium]
MSDSRLTVLVHALETIVGAGDDEPATLFTDDVTGWSPALRVSSLAELSEALAERDEALSNVEVAVRSVHLSGVTATAEWRLDADHTGPLVVDDDVTVPATGRHVHLGGATFAEFQDGKIRSFRSYFDEMALYEQLIASE